MIITNALLVKYARKLVYVSLSVDIKQINTLMIPNNVSMIPIIPGGKRNLALIRPRGRGTRGRSTYTS